MSQLPPKAIDEFQVLWKKHFGQELPREEAILRAHQTLIMLRLLSEPLPERGPAAQTEPTASNT
jgi:hypothetical protein